MLARGSGKIINTASLLSFSGRHPRAQLRRLQRWGRPAHQGPRQRVGRARIQVNAIAPGYFRTSNTDALQADETRNRQILERIPAGRWGDPVDLAGAVVFLASAPATTSTAPSSLWTVVGWAR